MKAALVSIVFGLAAFFVSAEEPAPSYSRSLFDLGVSFTVGDSLAGNNLGYGFCYKWKQYLNPSQPSSFYFALFSGYYYHTAGGVDLADTKYVTFGWRGLIAPWLGVDTSISPVLGARIQNNTIEGSAYMGICPTLGLFVPVNASIDLALSYEPVFNLYSLGGGTDARNKTYNDIVLLIEFKSYSQVKPMTADQAW